jgi:molybdopterin/thiamine biosynthesis adenylyltransferase/rhodanese-related sulfurtransferase
MAKTYKELMADARKAVPERSVDDVQQQVGAAGPRPVLLDVREREEYREGHLEGALSMPRGFLEMRVEEAVPDKNAPIVAYCAGGTRSLLAGRILAEMGYTNVASMAGGYNAWKGAGHRIIQDRQFTAEQLQRYSRHFRVPEVGEAGQAKLLDSKVVVIGAGGLGCPALFYLAAAGVGTIGIVDMDDVDLSNLQRQILHTNDRVGMPKVESARLGINALNPDVNVVDHRVRLSSENAMEILGQYDVVVNGCDNFPTRYLVNDACVLLGKPLVDGSIFQFEGNVTVFIPREGPCYRCQFPEPPPPGAAPSCDEAGVLGVLPGLVGCFQALETIKLLLGIGRSLMGRQLWLDTLAGEIFVHRLRRDPNCLVCSENPTVTELIDYEHFCGLRPPADADAESPMPARAAG